MRGRVMRTVGFVVGCVTALAVAAAPAQARDGSVTSFDGTKIAYHFYPQPDLAAGQTAPTLMNGPGYSSGGAAEDDGTVQAAEEHGYNVLTWDPRGFGQSGGQVEVDSPMFEGRDAQALIDMLAKQPEVQLDKPGDPLLGMIGASYGGGIQLVTAAIDPRVDAITPQISWNSLITSLDKADTSKGGWGSVLVGVGTEGSSVGVTNNPAGFGPTGRQAPETTQAFTNGLTTGKLSAADQDFFRARGPDFLLSQIHVPTLLMQGTDDTLFTLHESIENYKALKANGVPVQMLWFCGGLTGGPVAHGVCNTPVGPDPALDVNYALRWLDHYIKGTAGSVGPKFSWISDAGVLRGASDYPVDQGTPVTASGSGTLVTATGDTSGALIEAQPSLNGLNIDIPTPATGTEMLGEPTLALTYSGTAVDSDGRAYAQIVDNASNLVLGNQVTPIPLTLDGATHTTTLPLEGVAADVTEGKSYKLQIIGGTTVYFSARQPASVNFSSVDLTIPTAAPDAAQQVPPPAANSCPPATGRLSKRLLGPVKLGAKRKRVRHALSGSDRQSHHHVDSFCLSPNGIRVGYASSKLLKHSPRSAKRHLRGKSVLLLSSNGRYALRGVRPGSSLKQAKHKLHLSHAIRVGKDRWFFVRRGKVSAVIRARGGAVGEVGIANRHLTSSGKQQRRFLKSFF
jgi:ABC-2 type transport system ATP-binding protein